ncbi:MAG: 2-C-methyl-D-erythritol 4-phosphate cytidylyltransferase [Deltaproteobacteria bacterium]|jgi:2-C-methyl-D-erythritol 4-phosphate cytidylyltransferase/2-C-methyl-D-erythritol 2,4-cyclodiphosphate synthase|nr:2-C-methyl-D-erythritol 4-phosphate cytidylyltransferase [Deltaproteobacteria bacterium]
MADDFYTSAVILGGGKGERFNSQGFGGGRFNSQGFGGGEDRLPKQFLPLGSGTVLSSAIGAFAAVDGINEIVVVLPAGGNFGEYAEKNFSNLHKNIKWVGGGQKRSDSARLGFLATDPKAQVILIHDGARPLVSPRDVDKVRLSARRYGAAILATPLRDTLKVAGDDGNVKNTLDRGNLWQAQTPQGFGRAVLEKAFGSAGEGVFTDDASMVEALGTSVKLVEGGSVNFKITTASDMFLAQKIVSPAVPNLRVGQGWDFHRFSPDRPLMLGGVYLPGEMGLAGHSDADVLAHALVDAVLGAGGLGDIGCHFPPGEPAWKGASGHELISLSVKLLAEKGFFLMNADLTLIGEKPRISDYRGEMIGALSKASGLAIDQINLKGKTTEGLGFIGRGEGLAAAAVVLAIGG